MRTAIALIAAAWFLWAGTNLGNGYPLAIGPGPAFIEDTTARAVVDLGRSVLVGLAILSICLVDVAWVASRLDRIGRGA